KTLTNFIGLSTWLRFNAGEPAEHINMGISPMSQGTSVEFEAKERLRSVAGALSLVLAVVSVTTLPVIGQQADSTAQTATAERAFIANAGGDFGHYGFDSDRATDRVYGVFFADMKKWGRYEIVSSPAHADWVFQINAGNSSRCIVESVPNQDPKNPHEDTRIRVVNDDWVELVMMDVKTMGVRKRFVEHIKASNPFSSYEMAFDRAVAALIDDVNDQLGKPGDKTTAEHLQSPAPVPPQISSAQTVFLTDISDNDDGADLFSGGGARLYQQMLEELKSWGRYELAAKATQAELILDVSFQVHRRCDGARDHRLRLFVRDPRTEILLWGVTTHIRSPILQGNQRKAFDAGVAHLVNEIRNLVSTPTWSAGASIPSTRAAPDSGPPPASSVPVSATVSAIAGKSVLKSGSEVKVEVAIKNGLKGEDLEFAYREGDPLTCIVAVRDSEGNLVPATEQGRKVNEAHAGWQGRFLAYSLHTGETDRRECAVSELYDMSRAGKYFIHVQQVDGRPAQSNTLELTVVP
ncbi:MAG TPA: hypothetical protein VKD24_00385, partial [Candidatus Angelobacter sp.]|nr:hypothetical protein [Candidatus Angelobacter sp.]